MKKILFATDGSTHSRHAANVLAGLPHSEELEITIVAVVNTPQMFDDGSQAQWFVDYVREQQAAAEKDIDELKHVFAGTAKKVTPAVKQGRVGATLVQAAVETAAELIVMGAKGHSQVGRILLGSTSDYVATHAPCSVLIVRQLEKPHPDGKLRIAIGYDESAASQSAIQEFAAVKWGLNSTVHLLSVIPTPPTVNREYYPIADLQAKITRAIGKAASDLSGSCQQVRTQILDKNHIGEGIIEFAEGNHCDLIVVGETPRNVLGRILMGSVSRYVLRHAPCSVWITRNRSDKLTNQSVDLLPAT